MFDRFSGTDRSSIVSLLAIVAIVGSVGIAAISGGVGAVEVENSTVDVGDDTGEIYVTATFNGTIDDANATADVVIEDPNGSEFVNESISGNASGVVTQEWAVNDTDPVGNYSIVVDADSGVVDSVSVGTFAADSGSGGGGGSGGSSDGLGSYMGIPIWILALGGAAIALIAHNRYE